MGRRIGPHHLAHLRAVADGLDGRACARLYLGIDESREAQTVHDELTARVRLAARQAGERHHRLIGIRIKDKARQAAAPGAAAAPTLDEYIEQKGFDGWSESEQQEMYEADHPPGPTATSQASAQALQRRELSRQRVVAILSRLELNRAATATPQITDEVDAWFAGHLAKRLVRAGFLTLGQLAERIRARGAWYTGITAIGKAKAAGIAQQLEQILPGSTSRATLFSDRQAATATSTSALVVTGARSELQVCELGTSTAHRADNIGGITSDRQALEDWVTATAGSVATAKSYQREARRLMLWVQMERAGKGLASFKLDDAQAYRAFLAYIPEPWISRAKAAPGTEGWSPFRGQISAASQRQALTVVAAWFDWLVNAEYIRANPWRLIKKSGQNRGEIVQALDTKAFSDKAMAEVISFVERQTPNPAQARARFVIAFLASTGIRSAELLSATVGDVRAEPEGMFLRVTGKGQKLRDVMLVGSAVAALNEYLHTRGLDDIEHAPAAAPLLAHQDDAMQPVGYMTLYKTTRQWLARAVTFSTLSDAEKSKLQGASAHWLRHTFGTRAVAAGAPLDVIQQQLGHSNINTTMSIYSRAPLARRAAELQKVMSRVGV